MWKGRCSLLLLLCLSAHVWGQGERQKEREEGGGEMSQVSDAARTSGNQSSEEDLLGSHSQSASSGSSPKVGVPSKEKEREIVRFVPELSPSIIKPGRVSNGSWYIMFYASWCQYSQEAMPHFLEIFQYIVDTNTSGVYIGKIDITKHGAVGKHFHIKATPTFIFFKHGRRYEFTDQATAENLKSFMLRVLRSEVSQVNTSQQLAELQKIHPVLFILVDDGELDLDWRATYMKLAYERILRARYLYTTNPDILKEFHVPSFPAILVIKDGTSYPFKGALSAYSLSVWLSLERFTAFPSVNATTVKPYLRLSTGTRLGVLVVNDDPAQRRVAQRKAIEVVRRVASSRKLHKTFQFVLLESIDTGERMTQGSLELPALFAFEPYSSYYYPYKPSDDEKGMTEDSIVLFFSSVAKGKVQPKGGPSFYHKLLMIWARIYATVQTMITHRPWISGVTIFCVLGVIFLYLTLYCNRSKPKQRRPRRVIQARQKANKVLRNSSVRRRTTGAREDEATTGSGSESASYSETETRKDK